MRNIELKNEIIKKYGAGWSIRKISKELKLKKDIIKNVLEKENITKNDIEEVAVTNVMIKEETSEINGVQSGVHTGVPILKVGQIDYINTNFKVLMEMIEIYKEKNFNINENEIYLELPLESEENKDFKTSIRVNKTIWEEFKILCKNQRSYTQKELVSMALKEYIDRYKK